MNKIKSMAAVGAAAVLLTASLASAQVGTVRVDKDDTEGYWATGNDDFISFTVKIDQKLYVKVVDNKLETDAAGTIVTAKDLTMSASSAIAPTDLKYAGYVEVETNIGAWDVQLEAKNGGRLAKTADASLIGTPSTSAEYLKNLKTNSDALLVVRACHYTAEFDVANAPATGGPPANCPGSGQAVLSAAPVSAPISLATAFNKATGFRKGIETGAFTTAGPGGGDGANFVLWAGIPATIDELAGNGTYAEELAVTFLSWY